MTGALNCQVTRKQELIVVLITKKHHYLLSVSHNSVITVFFSLTRPTSKQQNSSAARLPPHTLLCIQSSRYIFQKSVSEAMSGHDAPWHSAELTLTGASKTCLSWDGGCKPQWCLFPPVWCQGGDVLCSSGGAGHVVKNQYVTLWQDMWHNFEPHIDWKKRKK